MHGASGEGSLTPLRFLAIDDRDRLRLDQPGDLRIALGEEAQQELNVSVARQWFTASVGDIPDDADQLGAVLNRGAVS